MQQKKDIKFKLSLLITYNKASVLINSVGIIGLNYNYVALCKHRR